MDNATSGSVTYAATSGSVTYGAASGAVTLQQPTVWQRFKNWFSKIMGW